MNTSQNPYAAPHRTTPDPGSGHSAVTEGALRAVAAEIAAGTLPAEPPAVVSALRARRCLLGREALEALAESLCEQALLDDPLGAYLADEKVTDILVNGPGEIWVERSDRLDRTEAAFPDEAAVRRYAQRLATQAGRRLDDASPYVDVRLPDGTRLHAVLPPLAVGGTVISLRLMRRRAFTLEELRVLGTLNEPGVALLARIVESRVPFLISGGAGTGKTTLLSSMLSLADPRERIVLIEDCSELVPDHPHVVRLESRPANQEGRGQVTLQELVRQSLRMRPSRIVLGEVRGGEIMELFAALNTGHEGGCGTIHANRPQDIPARIEALALLGGVSREAVHSQASAALRVAVHLDRDQNGRRYLQSIAVVRRRTSMGPIHTHMAVSFDSAGHTREWTGYPLLAEEIEAVAPPAGSDLPPADPLARTGHPLRSMPYLTGDEL